MSTDDAPAVPKAVALDEAAVVDAFRHAGEGGGGAGEAGGGGGRCSSERQTTLKELKVSRGSKRDFSVPVYTAGAVVSWTFLLKEYDINFSVTFIPAETEAASEEDATVVVHALVRAIRITLSCESHSFPSRDFLRGTWRLWLRGLLLRWNSRVCPCAFAGTYPARA
jgi:hypothetical protein